MIEQESQLFEAVNGNSKMDTRTTAIIKQIDILKKETKTIQEQIDEQKNYINILMGDNKGGNSLPNLSDISDLEGSVNIDSRVSINFEDISNSQNRIT